MYAIVDIASQQFKVEAGMDIFVNRLQAKNGESVEFNKVLLIDAEGAVKVGTPLPSLTMTPKQRKCSYSRKSVARDSRL